MIHEQYEKILNCTQPTIHTLTHTNCTVRSKIELNL